MQGTDLIKMSEYASVLKWIIGGLISLIIMIVAYFWKRKDSSFDNLEKDIKSLLGLVSKIDSIQEDVKTLSEDLKEHQKDYFQWKEKLIALWTIHEINGNKKQK